MPLSGRLLGLRAEPVEIAPGRFRARYIAEMDSGVVVLDEHLDAGITLRLSGNARCRHCDAPMRRHFGAGYCYACFSTLARCDLCVMSPDRCHYHLGTCREPDWGDDFCMQPHWVYLALTSGPKVGITRHERLLERWMDQGATRGLKLAQAPTRRAAGVLEALLKRFVNDRTDWRRLVTGITTSVDLPRLASQLRRDADLSAGLRGSWLPADEARGVQWLPNADVVELEYPLRGHSPAVRLPLDAQNPAVRENLCGIMGQYLMLSRGVVNVADVLPLGVDLEIGPPHVLDPDDDEQMSLFE